MKPFFRLLLFVLMINSAVSQPGSLDYTFSGDGKVTTELNNGVDWLEAMAVQPDGKIVVCGSSDGLSLVRYNAGGSLDATFSNNSKILPEEYRGVSIAVQQDGKIVVAGMHASHYIMLVRYYPDGSSDSIFNDAFFTASRNAFWTGHVRTMALQSDGKVVVAGTTDSDLFLARVNADGSPDSSFGLNGRVFTGIGEYDDCNSVTIQPDGKIVVAGSELFRYNPNGAPDSTFGMNGKVSQGGHSVALQPDGKIVVAGGEYIRRFNSDGSLDGLFADNGVTVPVITGLFNGEHAMTIQPDGKILSVGRSGDNLVAMRYTPAGVADSTFGMNGILTKSLGNGDRSIYPKTAIVQDNKILLGATYDFDFLLLRYHLDGTPDDLFGTDGVTLTNTRRGNDYGKSVVVQPDGKIIVTGSSDADIAVCRYNPDGSLDTTFNSNGIVAIPFSDYWYVTSITAFAVLQPDGKIIVAASSERQDDVIMRLHADGSIDSSFGINGTLRTKVRMIDGGNFIALQPDGKIVVLGDSVNGVSLERYFPDGTPDTLFNPVVALSLGLNVVLQQDGKIMVGGALWSSGELDFGFVRHHADGTLDSTFGVNGVAITDMGSGDEYCYSLALQTDGKIVATGFTRNASHDLIVARYQTDGSLDSTFGTGGIVRANSGTTSLMGKAVTIKPYGKIAVAAYTYGGDRQFVLLQYESDGTPDSSFGMNGAVETRFEGNWSRCNSVALQPDGKMLLAGEVFNGYDYDFALVRYSDISCVNYSVSLAASAASSNISSDGSITANLLAGEEPFDYDWSTQDTTRTISNLAAGYYCVTVTDAGGCSASACDSVVASTIIGIPATDNLKIEVRPNPADEFIFVKAGNELSVLSIYSIQGKLLKEYQLNNEAIIPIHEFLPGAYIYSIIQPLSRKTGFGKLIIE